MIHCNSTLHLSLATHLTTPILIVTFVGLLLDKDAYCHPLSITSWLALSWSCAFLSNLLSCKPLSSSFRHRSCRFSQSTFPSSFLPFLSIVMPFASASTSAFALAFTSAKAALDMAVPIADRSNSPPPEVLPVSNHVPYNPHARILRDQKQKKFYRRPRFNTPLRYRNNPDTRPLIDLDHGQSNRRILSPKSPRATRGSKSKTRSNLPHTPSASSPNTENNIINGRRIRKRPAQDTEIDLVAANNGVQDTTVPVVVNRQGENPSINTLQNNVSALDLLDVLSHC